MMRAFLSAAALLLMLPHAARAEDRVFDLHVHLHKGEASVDDYRTQLRAAGRTVTGFGAMWFGGPHQAPAGDIAKIRANNDALIAWAAKRPGMVPIATVHPDDGDAALAELDRVAARGVKILKIHPHTQRFDTADPRVAALAKRAGKRGVIVMIDNAAILPGDSEKLFNLALACPKTNFIFNHMGALNFRFWNMLKLARTAEDLFANNVNFDISGTLNLVAGSPIEAEFIWTLRNVGIDHVLLGSDYPQLTLPDTLAALDRIGLTPEEKAKIRYGNAARLLGLDKANPSR